MIAGVPKSQCSPSASHAMSCQSFNSREEDVEIWGQSLYVARKALGQQLAFSHSDCLIRRNNVDPASSTTGDVEAKFSPPTPVSRTQGQQSHEYLPVPEIAWIRRAQCEAINLRLHLLLLSRPTRRARKPGEAWVRRSCLHATTTSISLAGHQHLTLAVATADNADKGRSINPMTTVRLASTPDMIRSNQLISDLDAVVTKSNYHNGDKATTAGWPPSTLPKVRHNRGSFEPESRRKICNCQPQNFVGRTRSHSAMVQIHCPSLVF